VSLVHLKLDEIGVGAVVREYSLPFGTFPELQVLADTAQFEFTSPIAFHLRLQKVGSLVEVDGRLAFDIKEVCGRCLTPFETRIESSFEVTFTPRKTGSAEQELEEVELDDEELGLIPYAGEEIDLREPLQEQVVISLPISPLCKEECLGLCPECGTNLNETDCTCEKKLFNNKFTALKKLKLD
jgi:uncharacterized protein